METRADSPSEAPRPLVIVGIGASAGGVEALETFFSRVPGDTTLAFVVVQHLHAEYPSAMAEILGQHTSLPAQKAEDGMQVEPGHVYVIPANAVLTIERGVLRVASPAEPRRALIDHFLCSLAQDQGHHAVGVILSGAGTDGTLGLKAIKEQGGLVMAQSPATARYDSMPRSAIALGLVDHVLPVEDLPGVLTQYAAQIAVLPIEERPEQEGRDVADFLRQVCVALQRATGHDFSQYKQPTLLRRVQRRMLVNHMGSLPEYVDKLRGSPDEAVLLFNDLLIGVTQFFRDVGAFEAVASLVFPKLFERRRQDSKRDEREVRVWVAGCATGEEAYTLAILLREAAAGLDHMPGVKIFATDIDEHALDVARVGRYTEAIADQLSPARLERFFTKHGSVYQVDKSIREMCIFSVHNLIHDPPFSRLDLITCRNLLIYLEGELQKKLVPLFHYALRSGGYLFLGPSENLAAYPELFTTVDKKSRIFRRNDSVPAPLMTFPVLGPARAAPFAGVRGAGEGGGRGREIAQTFERVLLDNYAPASVVINERAEILYVSGRTGKYFEFPPGVASVNAIDMARRGLRPDLHTAIHKAVKTRTEALHENVMVEINGHLQRLTLCVRPLEEIEPGSGLFMVVFQDLGPPMTKADAEAQRQAPPASDALAQQLEKELRSTKEHLRASIEELETSNEELKSANEELLSTNEELQSTNEEMQTSKEELQSINEELQTVNGELTRKVDELDRANSDLQNLFANTNVATLFLDNELHIKKFSSEATEIFRIIATDIGRSVADFAEPFADDDLVAEVREVLRTLVPKEQQVRSADGKRWYMQRIRPYRSLDNVIGGAVLTFVDITALKEAEARIARLASLAASSQEAIVGLDYDGTITSWNAGARKVFGHAVEEAVGRAVTMLVPEDEAGAMAERLSAVQRGERVALFEARWLRKDGRAVPVDVVLSPVVESFGAPAGVSMIAHDLTERMQRDQALHESDHGNGRPAAAPEAQPGASVETPPEDPTRD